MGLRKTAKAARLFEPDIDEISGVGSPAHLHKGWIVMKEAPADGDEADDELDGAGKADDQGGAVATGTNTGASTGSGAGSAPDQGAPGGAGTAGAGGAAAASGTTPPTAEAFAAAQKALTDEQAARKAADDQLAALKAAVLGGSVDPEAVAKAEEAAAFEKALAELPAPFAKAWREDRVRLDEAEKVAKAERDARLDAEYVAVAKAEFGDLAATSPTEFAKALRAIDERLDEPTAKELRRVMKAAAASEATAELTREYGATVTPAEGTPMHGLTAKAAEIRKSEPTLSEAQAFDKAIDQNPELARQYSSTTGR